MENTLFKINKMQCSYDHNCHGESHKIVLKIDNLTLPRGKMIFIVGESGIGKSTILEVLGLMNNTIIDSPETEFIFCDGENTVNLCDMWRRNRDSELSAFRLKHFSFIFQSTNLMRNFTAYENVAITRMLQGYTSFSCMNHTSGILKELGLGHIDSSRMIQALSGGQQQRLSFARAVLPDFTVLFGDEPTGNLDGDNAVKVMQILSDRLAQSPNSSAIIVSHDMRLAVKFADVVVKIRKEFCEGASTDQDSTFCGVVDDTCVFVPDSDTEGCWTNGIDIYPEAGFEMYLKKC